MTTQDIWTTYSEDLKRFIFNKVNDKAAAEDVLQDTFIKIHVKLHTLKDITKLKSWLFSVARNTLINYFRSTNKTFEIAGFETETNSEIKAHTEKDCLQGILKNLPKKYRDPIYLSDIKGLKQQDIAEQLHLPLSTVKSQIQRARKQIAQGFMDCCGFVMNNEGHLVGEIQEKPDCKVCS